jgi:DNA invertase Pin-like site-specific DNA recombinase
MNSKKYIAYYRVSTAKQGSTGLGLEAQRTDVRRFVNCETCIIAEFTDVESGKKANRPELLKAIAECKATGATLIIAKLDRLSRDVEFIFALRNAGVDFKACDLPDFNTLTLGMFAVIAQHEREMISQRTKKALAVKKEKGVKLGSPVASQTLQAVTEKGLNARKANARSNENNVKATALIVSMRNAGATWTAIANELNAKGFRTRNAGKKRSDGTIVKGEYTATQVQRLFERAQNKD